MRSTTPSRDGHRATRPSTRVSLSPYVLDDITMTRREFDLARRAPVVVITHR